MAERREMEEQRRMEEELRDRAIKDISTKENVIEAHGRHRKHFLHTLDAINTKKVSHFQYTFYFL